MYLSFNDGRKNVYRVCKHLTVFLVLSGNMGQDDAFNCLLASFCVALTVTTKKGFGFLISILLNRVPYI